MMKYSTLYTSLKPIGYVERSLFYISSASGSLGLAGEGRSLEWSSGVGGEEGLLAGGRGNNSCLCTFCFCAVCLLST